MWSQVSGGSKTFYIFSGSTLIGEVQNGVAAVAYTWGASGLVSERLLSANRSLWYAYGPQGETRQLTDSTGAVADTYLYSPYGTLLASSGTDTNPFRYGGQAGYYTDANNPTTTILCGLRWYNPALGRWLSRDPIGYAGGYNLYEYCGSNPVGNVDPLGTDKILVVFGDNQGLVGSQTLYGLMKPVTNWGMFDTDYIVEYDHPTKQQIINELIDADAFYFWGHGGANSGGIYVNAKEHIGMNDLKLIALWRKKLSKRKMQWVDLHACDTSNKAQYVNTWLEITERLDAYPGLTAQALPPHFNRQETYTKPITKDPYVGKEPKKIGLK